MPGAIRSKGPRQQAGLGWYRPMAVVAAASSGAPMLPIVRLAELVRTAAVLVIAGGLVGVVVVSAMRWRGLAWTWGLPALLGLPIAVLVGWRATTAYGAAAVVMVVAGAGWHYRDVMAGGDLSARARGRRGPSHRVRARVAWRQIRRGRWSMTKVWLLARTHRAGWSECRSAARVRRMDSSAAPLDRARRCRWF